MGEYCNEIGVVSKYLQYECTSNDFGNIVQSQRKVIRLKVLLVNLFYNYLLVVR